MKQIVEIAKKCRIEFDFPKQGLRRLEHKFRRLEEYIEYHKLNKPYKQLKREFGLNSCDVRLQKYSLRPTLQAMTEEEKQEVARKIADVIENFNL